MDEIREQIMKTALNTWAKSSFRGILKWATGAGKTRAAIRAVNYFAEKYPQDKILYLCPTMAIIDNTIEEFHKFSREHLLDRVEFMCYASVPNKRGSYSLVVADECHHLVSPSRFPFFFENYEYRGILGLSATIDGNKKWTLHNYMPIISEISSEMLVKLGILATATIINFPVQLTSNERERYTKFSSKINYTYTTFGTQAWKYIGLRTRLLYNASRKLKAIKKITELFPGQKGVVFCMTKKSAEKVAKELGDICLAVHSGHSKKERQRRMELLNSKDSGVSLVAVPKLFDEGVTIPELTYGILLARSGKEGQFIQTFGRVLRNDLDNKHSFIIRLYAEDTQEEVWVSKSQANYKSIIVNSYEELRNTVNKERG